MVHVWPRPRGNHSHYSTILYGCDSRPWNPKWRHWWCERANDSEYSILDLVPAMSVVRRPTPDARRRSVGVRPQIYTRIRPCLQVGLSGSVLLLNDTRPFRSSNWNLSTADDCILVVPAAAAADLMHCGGGISAMARGGVQDAAGRGVYIAWVRVETREY